MSIKVIKPAETTKVCDMCGSEGYKCIDATGDKFSVNMGYIHSQSDRWEKTVSVNINGSIPYSTCDDLCVKCLKNVFDTILDSVG